MYRRPKRPIAKGDAGRQGSTKTNETRARQSTENRGRVQLRLPRQHDDAIRSSMADVEKRVATTQEKFNALSNIMD